MATHPKHFRLSAGFFSWLLANTSFGKDRPQTQQVGMMKGTSTKKMSFGAWRLLAWLPSTNNGLFPFFSFAFL
jgi:hypothetical protein